MVMTVRPGDLPSYRYGTPAARTSSDRAYDAAVSNEGQQRVVGYAELERKFVPEQDMRDYGGFTLDLSAIDKHLVLTSKSVIPWIQLRNMMLDGMQITGQPDAPIEVKWTTLLNYVAQHVPQGTMPAQSELHGKEPVSGLSNILITGLGLQGYEGALNNALIEAEGFAFADKDERDVLSNESGSTREQYIERPPLGNAHERKRWAREHIDPQAPISLQENPYSAVHRLLDEARQAKPNERG